MNSQTTEVALEACIERALTGHDIGGHAPTGGIQAGSTPLYGGSGWKRGTPGDFNAEFAVEEAMLWQFLDRTQGMDLSPIYARASAMHSKLESRIQPLRTLCLSLIAGDGEDCDSCRHRLVSPPC